MSVGPIWARLGPVCVLRSETTNWLYLGLDRPNRDSEGSVSPCQPPLLPVSTPQNGPNTPLDVVLAHQAPVWPGFGSETGPRLVELLFLLENDPGPFGVPVDVFPARLEAYFGLF